MGFSLFILLLTQVFQALALDCDIKSHKELGQEILTELNQNPVSCIPNSVHLTFDDGPSLSVTPTILKELEMRKVKATFFITTTHLETSNEKYKENRTLVDKTISAGHLLASHGHEHHAYDLRMDKNSKVLEEGFTQQEREEQIQKSMDLLQWSTQGKFKQQVPLLFRFPYGRGAMPSEIELNKKIDSGEIHLDGQTYSEKLKQYRQISPALQTIGSQGFSHLGWNHDSQDSSYGVKAPEKNILKEYIKKNLKNLCSKPQITKVALFHDIKEMNMTAIPLLIDLGRCMGLNYISAQDMLKDSKVESSGVLIDQADIIAAPVEFALKGLNTVEKIGANTCHGPIPEKSCWSEQYKKYYAHCTGGDSVCFEGEWKSRLNPIVQDNCH